MDDYKPTEPTSEQCSFRATLFENEHEIAYATWYPQMGGYFGKCVVVAGKGSSSCFDAYIWHDGDWPIHEDEDPTRIHHCNPKQFIDFGKEVLAKTNRSKEAK